MNRLLLPQPARSKLPNPATSVADVRSETENQNCEWLRALFEIALLLRSDINEQQKTDKARESDDQIEDNASELPPEDDSIPRTRLFRYGKEASCNVSEVHLSLPND